MSSSPTPPDIVVDSDEQDRVSNDQSCLSLDKGEGSEAPKVISNTSIWSWLNNNWVWEILSCVGSLLALTSIIVLLLHYDGKSIPSWPYGITINAILSWIIQVFNALMLGTVAACISQSAWIHVSTGHRPLADMNSYLWASRSIIGSVAFMFQSGFGQWASLGALITIFAVGAGPFVQQMAPVEQNLVKYDIPASLGRGQTYLEGGGRRDVLPTVGLMAAINAAVFSDAGGGNMGNDTALSPPIPMDCPTGECKKKHSAGMRLNVSGMTNNFEEKSAILNISSAALPESMVERAGMPGYGDSGIFSATEVRVSSRANRSQATAEHCNLYWCVNTYSAAIRSNLLEEKLRDSWYDPDARYYFANALFERMDLRPPSPKGSAFTERNFTINFDSSDRIARWLRGKMEMTNSVIPFHCDNESFAIMGPPDVTEFSPLLESYGLKEIFRRISMGMSARIRQLDSAAQYKTPTDPFAGDFGPVEGIGPVDGTFWKLEPQIQVRWAWVAFPATLLTLTMMFLLVTILQTKRGRLDVWKSSPTPLLCSGLDEEIQRNVRSVRDPVTMENVTADVKVKLEQDDLGDTWRLQS
ncbi:hypothetical protein BJX61DRAFT_540144 [Aspergillus egyptiacus]|nr:hypothetical protein BJX61DRAFT_540144 [Aspergillus egyptiacus]